MALPLLPLHDESSEADAANGRSVLRTHPSPTSASAPLVQDAVTSSRQANHDYSSGLTVTHSEPTCDAQCIKGGLKDDHELVGKTATD